jgi:cellobiose phosphorylase
VYPQNILGNEHPQFGLARNSWLSGTSSWTYQAATQFILGVRPTYKGLIIDPCVPRSWDAYTVTRVFRNASYRITIKNPNHKCKGDIALRVDGLEIVGPVVPVFADGKDHRVEAVIQ